MKKHNKLKRYFLVFEKVRSRSHPTFSEIQDHLQSHEIEVSHRTLQRDIKDIREEFGINILYDRTSNRYSLDEVTSINVESFYRLLEIVTTADFIVENFQDGRELISYVEFDAKGLLRGVEHLRPILTAIRKRRYVEFTHQNFHTGRSRNYLIAPFFLKEYQNRFYLIGRPKDLDESWAFGLDRIKDLTISKTPCEPISGAERKTFANIIGVSHEEGLPQEVILSVDPDQAKYLETLPWHRSMEVMERNKREVIFRLRVIPNYELVQKILMMGDAVRVLRPASLVKEVREYLESALKRYK